MTAAPAPLARIELARDARHALGWPAVLVLAGLVIAAGGGAAGLALNLVPLAVVAVAIGAVLVAIGIWIALRVRSLKLAVEVDYLHLTGIRVDRRYHLARGDLKRVGTSGPQGASLRTGPSALGWGIGRTKLGSGETIEVIRLGATPSAILIPTEKGRVAVAAAVEADLVQALLGAAQTRAERGPAEAPTAPAATSTAQVAAPSPAVGAGLATAATAASLAAAAPPPAVAVPTPPAPRAQEPEVQRRPLTGIERMALEEEKAFRQQATLGGTSIGEAPAAVAAATALPVPASRPVSPPTPAMAPPSASPAIAPTPAAMPAPAAAAATATAATATAAAVTRPARTRSFPLAVPRGLPRRRPPRPMAWRATRPTLAREIALLAIPLLAAGVVWFVAALTGASAGAGGLDPINFAILLCGPIAVLAIFLARTRWPRLAALSSLSAVLALALVARAVIG